MANNSEVNPTVCKDLLTCSICLENFKVPKCLPCLHTFCESCISTFISSDNKKEVKCPICRRQFQLDESKETLEMWLSKLPTNSLISSMIDKLLIKSSSKLCDSCKFNDETVKAVSWCNICEEALCKSCEKCHRSFKMTSDHLISTLDEMSANDNQLNIGGNIRCSEHSGEIIKIYCVDHSKPCCPVCATLSHRKCENVKTIDEAASGVKNSAKAVKLKKQLDENSQDFDKMVKNLKQNTSDIENKSTNILTIIEESRDAIIKTVNDRADKIKETLTASKKNAVITVTDNATEISSFKSTIDYLRLLLNTCFEQGTEKQFLLEMEKILSKYEELDLEMRNIISRSKRASIKFELNKSIADFHTNVQEFGKVSVDISTNNTSIRFPKVNFRTGKIRVVHTIEVDINKGGARNISGLFVEDSIIITDSVNQQVIKYDSNFSQISSIKLPKRISDITLVDKGTVAVASTYGNEIYIIEIGEMIKTITITTDSAIFGLQYVGDAFLCAHSGTLKWISKSGLSIKTAETAGDTWYIYARDADTYICADGENSVSYTKERSKLFTYTKPSLKNPRGIDMDFEGNIYIVGYISDNIHQLTNNGEFVREVSTEQIGLNKPWVLRFKPNTATFLLTSNGTGKVLICQID